MDVRSGAMHFFAQLSIYELETSLQVMKYLALLMLKQAGGAKECIVPISTSLEAKKCFSVI